MGHLPPSALFHFSQTKTLTEGNTFVQSWKEHWDQEMGRKAEAGKTSSITVGSGSELPHKWNYNRRKQVSQRSHELQEEIPSIHKN